jgi:hypothetical protein
MKAKSLILLSICACMVILTCLSSCSSDNDENKVERVETLLQGKWKLVSCSSYYYSKNFNYLDFKSDGTVLYSASKTFDSQESCIWTYNEESKMLRIYRSDGYYSFNFKFEFEDNGDWVGTESESDGDVVYIYTRYTENEQ